MTSWAITSSRSRRARMTRRIWSSTSPPIASRVCLRASSSSWKCRAMAASALPEPTGDVVFRSLVAGGREHLLGDPELDELAEQEEAGPLGDPRGLLHVVGDDRDGQLLLEVVDQLLDLGGGDGVERGARLVHEEDLGIDREGPRDAEPLLLAAREAHPRLVEIVLHLVPEGGVAERPLHLFLEARLPPHPAEPQAGGYVVEDRHGGEGVRLLEDHADPPPHLDRIHSRGVEVLAVEEHLPGH